MFNAEFAKLVPTTASRWLFNCVTEHNHKPQLFEILAYAYHDPGLGQSRCTESIFLLVEAMSDVDRRYYILEWKNNHFLLNGETIPYPMLAVRAEVTGGNLTAVVLEYHTRCIIGMMRKVTVVGSQAFSNKKTFIENCWQFFKGFYN